MKKVKKILLILSVVLYSAALFSCGNEDKGDGTGHMYDVPLLGNPSSLDPQFADDPSSNTVIKNLYSGLMETDSSGNVVCRNAESYTVSDDGKMYTFKLREDNFWFFDENDDDIIDKDEYFPVTAQDYAFALRRVLDPQMKSPYADDFMCISNAPLVYSGAESPASLGILAADSKTLIIALDQPNADFLRLMSTAPSYPCREEFFEQTKGRYGLDDRSVMSNGAFFVRQWFYDPYGNNNILYMKRNDANWSETFDIFPSFLSFTIEKSEDDIRELFKDDEIECFTTLNSSRYNPDKYIIDGKSAITLGLIFNPEDECYSNANMQRALSLAIDRESIAKELNGDLQIARGIIPPSVMIGGKSYREIVPDAELAKFDSEAALDYYEEAKSELDINTVETVKIIVNGETMDSTYLHKITQKWQELFRSYVGIEDLSADEFESRLESGDYSIALYPLCGRYASPTSFFQEFERRDFLKESLPEEKFTPALTSCSSESELIAAYSSSERFITENFKFIPLFYKNSYLIADSENEQIAYDPFSGGVDYRLALNYD